jgi:sister chromatid cohesion protein DCC1
MTLHPSPTAALLKTTTAGNNKNNKTHTYSLRQKNTSNALILLEPTGTGTGIGEGAGLGLRAIATLHETIELVAEAGEAPAPRAKGKWHEKFGRGR